MCFFLEIQPTFFLFRRIFLFWKFVPNFRHNAEDFHFEVNFWTSSMQEEKDEENKNRLVTYIPFVKVVVNKKVSAIFG